MTNQSLPKGLESLAMPLVEYLKLNYHPHAAIVITDQRVAVVEDLISVPVCVQQNKVENANSLLRFPNQSKTFRHAKELKETSSIQEAQMLTENGWLISSVYFKNGQWNYSLFRVD